jgi:hypothetical protein
VIRGGFGGIARRQIALLNSNCAQMLAAVENILAQYRIPDGCLPANDLHVSASTESLARYRRIVDVRLGLCGKLLSPATVCKIVRTY